MSTAPTTTTATTADRRLDTEERAAGPFFLLPGRPLQHAPALQPASVKAKAAPCAGSWPSPRPIGAPGLGPCSESAPGCPRMHRQGTFLPAGTAPRLPATAPQPSTTGALRRRNKTGTQSAYA